METKKKLRNDIEAIKLAVVELRKDVNELLKAKEEESDIISGKEAARMLGYNSEYVSSTWLGKVGIKYTKGDNGCLMISRKSLEGYLETRIKTTED